MPINPKTKLAKVRDAMREADWESAIKLVAKFPSLGEDKKTIQRARDAINNPELYKQMGFDVETLKNAAIEAIKKRHNRSWEIAKAERKTRRTNQKSRVNRTPNSL